MYTAPSEIAASVPANGPIKALGSPPANSRNTRYVGALSRKAESRPVSIERQQHNDEAQIFGQHGMDERGQRRGNAECGGNRHQRRHRPAGGDLAVVPVPDFWQQQRSDRDRQQDADERQRPRPRQGSAVEAGRRVGDIGRRREDDRGQPDETGQCASSQLPAARASTCSGTDSDTAGSGAYSITRVTTGRVASTSRSGTSNTSSSCTCSSMRADSFASASTSGMRIMARRMMSAALPCSRALMAARSLKARSDGFLALISG